MNLKRFEYFVTLAQVGNLRKASEMLHISPPALSKAMKLLEEELESSLWIKDGRKMILSDVGKNLLKRAPRLMQELHDLKESINDEKSVTRPIRIATFEVFSTYFLTFMDKLKWDQHSLELHELLPGEVERFVAQGDVDLGITYMPIPDPDLDFLKVTSIEMGTYVRKGSFKGELQQTLPYVIPVAPLQGVPTKVRGLDGWPEEAFRRKVVHRVTLMESALELCRQGRVAGYFPVFVAEEHNKRVKDAYQLERRRAIGRSSCHTDVYIVKRKSYEETDIVKQLAKAIRLICV